MRNIGLTSIMKRSCSKKSFLRLTCTTEQRVNEDYGEPRWADSSQHGWRGGIPRSSRRWEAFPAALPLLLMEETNTMTPSGLRSSSSNLLVGQCASMLKQD